MRNTPTTGQTRIRYLVLAMIFIVTTLRRRTAFLSQHRELNHADFPRSAILRR
ncbi:hypothetical protein SAMN05428989_3727 [Pseudoxanthomonas sp. GM95]|nr:hypothetical protein SAMN05428989_3727 [Pseudoxanthomonas sp. GM95]